MSKGLTLYFDVCVNLFEELLILSKSLRFLFQFIVPDFWGVNDTRISFPSFWINILPLLLLALLILNSSGTIMRSSYLSPFTTALVPDRVLLSGFHDSSFTSISP